MDKEDLKKYHQEEMSIRILKQDIEVLESLMVNISAKPISDNPGSSTSSPDDRLVDIIDKLDKKRQQYIRALDKLLLYHTTIEDAIEEIGDIRYRNILKAKYILGKTLNTIAVEMGISERQCQRLHGDALEWIRKIEAREKIYDELYCKK